MKDNGGRKEGRSNSIPNCSENLKLTVACPAIESHDKVPRQLGERRLMEAKKPVMSATLRELRTLVHGAAGVCESRCCRVLLNVACWYVWKMSDGAG
jgi:hypothetical protein